MSPTSLPPTAARRAAPGAAHTAAAERWRVAGLVVHTLWALLLAVAIALWLRVAAFPGEGEDVHGYVRLFGAPFVLLALGILWWLWRSARHLLHRRPEGWLLPIALGAVALLQSALTAMPMATSGIGDADAVTALVVGLTLGAASLGVGVLGRRSWALAPGHGSDQELSGRE